MKINVSSSDLKAAIDQVSAIVPKRTSIPYFEYIKIKTANNRVYLSATDSKRFLTVDIHCDVLEDGFIIIPLSNLKRICNVTGSVTVTGANKTLTATNGKKKTSVKATDAQENDLIDFPTMEDASFLLDMNADILNSVMKKLETFCAKDDSRPIHTGINFNFTGKRFESVDGYRLAIADMKSCNAAIHAESGSYVVPACAAGDLRKITKPLNDRQRESGIGVYATEKYMQFSGAGFTYIIRRLEGKFLDMQSNLDEMAKANLNAIVDVKDVLPIAKEHASYFTTQEKSVLFWFIQNGKINFYTETSDICTSDSVEFYGSIDEERAEDYIWIFNPKYFKEGLEIFDKNGDVCFRSINYHGWENGNPVCITPLFMDGVGADGVSYIYMTLPVRATEKTAPRIPAIRKFCA